MQLGSEAGGSATGSDQADGRVASPPRMSHSRSGSFGASLGSPSKRRAAPIPLELSPPQRYNMLGYQPQRSADEPSELSYALASPNLAPSPILTSASTTEEDRFADHEEDDQQNYAGLGLGLPWSGSTLASSGSGQSSASPLPPGAAPHRTRMPSTSASSSNGGSPVFERDRSKLIGLGELATPRWTAALHDHRWGYADNDPPPMPGQQGVPESPLLSRQGRSPALLGRSPRASLSASSPGLKPSASTSSAMSAIDALLSDFGTDRALIEPEMETSDASIGAAISGDTLTVDDYDSSSRRISSTFASPAARSPRVLSSGDEAAAAARASRRRSVMQAQSPVIHSPAMSPPEPVASTSKAPNSARPSLQSRTSSDGEVPKDRRRTSSGSRLQYAAIESPKLGAHPAHHLPSPSPPPPLPTTPSSLSLGPDRSPMPGPSSARSSMHLTGPRMPGSPHLSSDRRVDGYAPSPRASRSQFNSPAVGSNGATPQAGSRRPTPTGSRSNTPSGTQQRSRSRSRSSCSALESGPLQTPAEDVPRRHTFAPGQIAAPTVPAMHSPRTQQMRRPPSNEGVQTSAASIKRGSSSSTSYSAQTTPASTSRETSAASFSTFATSAAPSQKVNSRHGRRGSASSDASSIYSLGAPNGESSDGQNNDSTPQAVPPVPPLPKSWEAYRTTATPGISSPREVAFPAGPASPRESLAREESLSSPVMVEHPVAKMPSTKKWSLASALGIKSASVKASNSFNDLQSVNRSSGSSGDSGNRSSLASSRKAQSERNIADLAAGRRPSAQSSVSPSLLSGRERTESQSSAQTAVQGSAPPAITQTSPGRSRSSLLAAARRTPSSMPFFRASKEPEPSPADSPNVSMSGASVAEEKEKSGRKSILGITFRSRKSTSTSNIPSSPSIPSGGFMSATAARAQARAEAAKANADATRDPPTPSHGLVRSGSGLIGRRRTKTLPTSDGPPRQSPAPALPPLQLSAIPQATARRIETLSMSSQLTLVDPPNSRVSPSPSRSSIPRLSSESQSTPLAPSKSGLPTIAGSPNVVVGDARLREPAGTPTRQIESGSSLPVLQVDTAAAEVEPPQASPALEAPLSADEPSTAAAALSPIGDVRKPVRTGSSSTSSSIPRSRSSASAIAVATARPGATESAQRTTTAPATRSRLPTVAATSMNENVPPAPSPVTNEFGVLKHVRRRSLIQQPDSLLRTPAKSSLPTSASSSRVALSAVGSPTALVSPRRTLTKTANHETPLSGHVRRTSLLGGDAVSSIPGSARSSRLLTSKLTTTSRLGKSSTSTNLAAKTGPTATTLARPESSASTSSHATTPVNEDEIKADEEMSAYVRRVTAKKLAAGASADELHRMFEFPTSSEPLSAFSCRDALQLFGRHLSEYERTEILDYPQTWYYGQGSSKIQAQRDLAASNFGYDDERGDYIVVDRDHILFRYEITGTLGKGSFGQVLQCRDHCTGEMVAIKIIRNKKRFHHQALIEIKVLENLRKWDPEEKHNVVKMTDSFSFRGHLCIVTELLSINLYELIKANSFQGFSLAVIRHFTAQILASLTLLRHHRVVHCDLKPENVLLKHPTKSAVRVIDFGSSCFEHEKVYTYIQSRFYRSPEVILGQNYHMAIDMWSLGCIIAEIHTGVPLFPGENEQEQLACIMEVLGPPDKYLIDRSSRKKLFFDSQGLPRPVVNSKGRRRRISSKTLAQAVKSDDPDFIDFLSKCLIYDPDRRMKAQAALRHPFVKGNRLATSIGIAAIGSPNVNATPRRRTITTGNAPMTAPSQRIRTRI